MSWEIVGTLASLIVLISFVLEGEKKIRIVNIIGCVFFIVYGFKVQAYSVIFLNGALLAVHIYKLIRLGERNG